ncbi:Triacylglycerol lipase [Musa troglodytarum]|uniref:Triacylglycerol lipase n=1 Tax=Musa troglodytarum TaxID=320322 RepID=A0A9E7GR99_9LILI|nr:Triacylglycerol lipase [Musa troglodytarum]
MNEVSSFTYFLLTLLTIRRPILGEGGDLILRLPPTWDSVAGFSSSPSSSMGFRCELAGAHGRWQLLQSLEAADDGVCTAVVSPQGYECQEYEVKTQDGYILTMHRIPQGRGGGRAGKRQPVLLQHGVLMDGLTWLLNPPQQSLAFVLADNGFDVWITHGRGTRWSRRHESLDTSDPAYWAWSWDELASFDLPATVGFVVRQTGQKLHYVGHSMMLGALGMAEFDPKGAVGTNFLESVCAMPGVNCYDLMASFTGTDKLFR